MAKTKISTLAKELNLALPTVFSFLRDKGISIEESPNTRVEDNVVELLVSNFKSDKDKKNKPAGAPATQRRAAADTPATTKAPDADDAGIAQNTVPSDSPLQKPRIIGKIELDKNGNPVPAKPRETPKPAPRAEAPKAEAPKPEAPKTEPARAEAPKAQPAKPEVKPAQAPAPKADAPKAEQPKQQSKT
ncbi:MAG: hypothetical protein K1V80_05425, partial [Muribaculaceae bacterium]